MADAHAALQTDILELLEKLKAKHPHLGFTLISLIPCGDGDQMLSFGNMAQDELEFAASLILTGDDVEDDEADEDWPEEDMPSRSVH